VLGYGVVPAAATDPAGVVTLVVAGLAVCAAARFALEGEIAGSSPVPAIPCGLAAAEGSVGAVALATVASSAGLSCFHQASLDGIDCNDWQPTVLATANAITSEWTVKRVITLPRLMTNSRSRGGGAHGPRNDLNLKQRQSS
jgi:hypothetical protein